MPSRPLILMVERWRAEEARDIGRIADALERIAEVLEDHQEARNHDRRD